jgi:TIR domain
MPDAKTTQLIAGPPPRIFISYRTSDSETMAGRIYDNLKLQYHKTVLLDYESMTVGRDFRDRLIELLQQSDVLTAIIGPKWAGPVEDGKRWFWSKQQYRITQDRDWVRFEIETAIKRKIPVIPVLVYGANMPSAAILPDTLRDFTFVHAQRVNDREDFKEHIRQLNKKIDEIFSSINGEPPAQATEVTDSRLTATSSDEADLT